MAKYGKTAPEGKSFGERAGASRSAVSAPRVGRRTVWLVTLACLLGAGLSLLLPLAPSYDPWSWLVWGRELAALELDTSGGPSWKPLPVLVTTALSPLGDAAPELWLVLARTAWLASLALAWRLAARLVPPEAGRASRVVAGAVAAGSLLILAEPQTAWLRHFAHGFSEPLVVALLLGAVDRHLGGRRGQALGLLLAASLLRPETWPLLALYAVSAWRARPALRPAVVAALVAVPMLWLGGDWLGSGAWLTGGERACVSDAASSATAVLDRLVPVVEQAAALPPPPAWAAAALGVLLAALRGQRRNALLLAASLVWVGAVAVEVVIGCAPLARFLIPAAALACVLAGAGVGWMWSAAAGAARAGSPTARRWPASWAAALLVIVLAAVPFAVARAAALPDDYLGAVERARDVAAPTAAVAAAGPAAVARCRAVAVEDFSLTPVLAWELELPLGQVTQPPASGRIEAGAVVAREGGALAERASAVGSATRRLGTAGGWVVLSLPCPS